MGDTMKDDMQVAAWPKGISAVTLFVKHLNGPMDRPWGIRIASFVDPGGYI